ncbi:FHA domain-containing protein FHA2-like [Zingiber officinale]|uniref:FHA domain-containing protein n=1 Tax=Zingiber officinale TaxID=94328 RepID=A0A8J5KIW7_ZINOF|nr:FHA domain-containing protein FHA2-like [Zingiber officinale]KAG6478618.1 hypothetical protein ZIOFF_062061 [Zingiber officinale]
MAKGRSGGSARRGGSGDADEDDAVVGFAKLQGEDFEYYMQTYSILLGRSSKTSEVDVDLASMGSGLSISRCHARIFYDFPRRCFSLEVLGRNGCIVEGVHHQPGSPPIKLDSQDLIQMGEKMFYFLLPSQSIVDEAFPGDADDAHNDKGGGEEEGEETEEEEEEGAAFAETGKFWKRKRIDFVDEHVGAVGHGRAAALGHSEMVKTRSRADREADNQLLLQLEEKEVISSITTLLPSLCGPGEQFPIEKLHAKLFEIYGHVWHRSRVRRYLTSEECPKREAKGRPWFGLLMLLKKYPEHFSIHTEFKGRVVSELVSLVH